LRLLKNKYGENHREYTKAARELVQVMNRFPSLDEALHYLSANEKCVTAAKAAIVCAILSAEKKCELKFVGQLGGPDLAKAANTWTAQFLSMAISNLTQGSVSSIFENVTIINFNYDRAFEHYIYWALQRDALVPRSEAGDIVKRMRVIRPYGRVGPLEWQEDGGVVFGGPDSLDESLFQIADAIRTYTEQHHTELPAQIDTALSNARLVVLLGFGFHSQNVQLFGPTPNRSGEDRYVFATASGIADENHQLLKYQLSTSFMTPVPVHLSPKKAGEMLTDLRPTIMAAAN
jgi:hypothetical protein